MSGKITGEARLEWRSHWTVVMAGMFGMSISPLTNYSTGVMIAPLEAEFGWSRAEISSGPTITAVLAVILAPFMGMAIDRYGPRRIALIGVLAVCAGIAALSSVSSNLWTWWAIWLGLAFAVPFLKPTVWTAAVASLFRANRGLAIAVMLSGSSVGASIIPFGTFFLVEQLGWRNGYLALGAITATIIFPVLFLFFFSAADHHRIKAGAGGPADSKVLAGVSAREGFLSITFLQLAVAALLIAFAMGGALVNLVPIMSLGGISRGTAAGLAGLIGVSAVIGRLSAGVLIDRYRANIVGAVCVCFPIFSFLIFIAAPASIAASALAIILLGLAIGAEMDAVAYIAARRFGLRNFGLLFGTISGLISLGSGVAPMVANHIYDMTGSYAVFLWAGIPLAAISSVLFLLIRISGDEAEEVSAPRV